MRKRSWSACVRPWPSHWWSWASACPAWTRHSTWNEVWHACGRDWGGQGTTVAITRSDEIHIRSEQDVVLARQGVRRLAQEIGFGIVDQTKLVTAASELARNVVVY